MPRPGLPPTAPFAAALLAAACAAATLEAAAAAAPDRRIRVMAAAWAELLAASAAVDGSGGRILQCQDVPTAPPLSHNHLTRTIPVPLAYPHTACLVYDRKSRHRLAKSP